MICYCLHYLISFPFINFPKIQSINLILNDRFWVMYRIQFLFPWVKDFLSVVRSIFFSSFNIPMYCIVVPCQWCRIKTSRINHICHQKYIISISLNILYTLHTKYSPPQAFNKINMVLFLLFVYYVRFGSPQSHFQLSYPAWRQSYTNYMKWSIYM